MEEKELSKDNSEQEDNSATENTVEAEGQPSAEGISSENESAGSDDPRDEEIKVLREKLTESNLKVDELNNKFLRAAADNENYRKRMVREREELQHRTTSRVIEEILPAIDNMKLGLSASDVHPEAKIVADGFVMVFEQLKNALSQLGVEEITAESGSEFNPNEHECLSQQANAEIEENKIVATTRSGYKLNGKLLRAAAVILSTGPAELSATEDSANQETEEANS